jgi:hypothetical protein
MLPWCNTGATDFGKRLRSLQTENMYAAAAIHEKRQFENHCFCSPTAWRTGLHTVIQKPRTFTRVRNLKLVSNMKGGGGRQTQTLGYVVNCDHTVNGA